MEFNINRFTQTFKVAWASQPVLPYILMLILLLVSLYPLSYLAYSGYAIDTENVAVVYFLFYFMVLGLLYGEMSFVEFTKTGSQRTFMMLPASIFEKWLAKILLTFIVFPTILFGLWLLVFSIFNAFAPQFLAYQYKPFLSYKSGILAIFSLLILILPFSISLKLFWKGKTWLKTFGLLAAIISFFYIIAPFTPINDETKSLFQIARPFQQTSLSPAQQAQSDLFWYFALFIPAFLLFVASFFLLKEREL